MWKNDFFDNLISDKDDDNKKLKYENIPILYQFRRLNLDTLGTLERNELWFSTPDKLNDPFDCLGIHWDSNEVIEFFKSSSNEQFEATEIETKINSIVSNFTSHTRVTCFTEELHNMPMWAHYADNHKGFCVEYNFKELHENNPYLSVLYPVLYIKNKIDFTGVLQLIINSLATGNQDYGKYVLMLMLLKNNEWNYEEEWRFIQPAKEKSSGAQESLVSPRAIYLGMAFDSKYIDEIKRRVDCPIYKMKISDGKAFKLDFERI